MKNNTQYINLLKLAKQYNIDTVQPSALSDLNVYRQDNQTQKPREYIKDIKTRDCKNQVSAMLPSLLEIIINKDSINPKFEDKINDDVKMKLKASINDYLIKHVYNSEEFVISHYKALKSSLILKYGIVKVIWDIETIKMKQIIKIDEVEEYSKRFTDRNDVELEYSDPLEDEYSQEITTIFIKNSKPSFQYIDISDFLYIPDGDTINNSSFIAHRARKEVGEIERLIDMGIYKSLDKEETVIPKNAYITSQNPWDSYKNANTISTAQTAENDKEELSKYVEVYECYTHEYDELGNRNNIIVTIIGNEIMRKEINPYGTYPFAIYQYDFDIADISSESISSDLKEAQKIRTDFLRLLYDNAYQNNRQKMIIDPTGYAAGKVKISDFNKDKGILFADPGSIDTEKLKPRQLPSDLYNIVTMLEKSIEKQTGQSNYSQGIPGAKSETATGITALLQQSQKRLRMITRLLIESGFNNMLKALTNMFIINNIMPEGVYLDSESGLGQKDDILEIQKLAAVTPHISSYINQLSQMDPLKGFEIYTSFMKTVMNTYGVKADFVYDVESFINQKKEEQQVAIEQQQLAQQQAMEAQQSAMEPVEDEYDEYEDDIQEYADESVPPISEEELMNIINQNR